MNATNGTSESKYEDNNIQHHATNIIYYILYIICYTLWHILNIIYCIVYIVYYILYIIYCIFCIIYYTLYFTYMYTYYIIYYLIRFQYQKKTLEIQRNSEYFVPRRQRHLVLLPLLPPSKVADLKDSVQVTSLSRGL